MILFVVQLCQPKCTASYANSQLHVINRLKEKSAKNSREVYANLRETKITIGTIHQDGSLAGDLDLR